MHTVASIIFKTRDDLGRTLNQNHSNDEKCGDNNTKDEDEKEREGASFIYAKEASCQCCQLCIFFCRADWNILSNESCKFRVIGDLSIYVSQKFQSCENEKLRVGNTNASGELQEKQIPKAIYNFYFPHGLLSSLLKMMLRNKETIYDFNANFGVSSNIYKKVGNTDYNRIFKSDLKS